MMAQTFALNPQGDLYRGSDGNLAMLSGPQAVQQNTVTAARAQKNEMQYAMDQGMPTMDTAFRQLRPLAFSAALRKVVSNVAQVQSIQSLSVTIQDGTIQYEADLLTDYGPINLQSNVSQGT